MNTSIFRICRQAALLLSMVLLFSAALAGSALADAPVGGETLDKTASMALIYGVLALLSLGLIGVYFAAIKQRDSWFVLLYVAIFVVNTGYLALSLSHTLEEALLANRIAYLGSVFLPLCMLMIILSTCRLKPSRVTVSVLVAVSILIFLLAASGGYLPLYYKEVSIVYINGVARLDKVYGPLHCLYLLYLLTYFGLMVAAILQAIARKKISAPVHAVILASIVLGNIGVWFVEQLIYVEFEFLSITYIICGIFLLLLSRMMQLYDLLPTHSAPVNTADPLPAASPMEQLLASWPEAQSLTARELEVLGYILENVKRRDIAERMCVSENTVKKHTSHIFAKLNITSRNELFARITAENFENN